MTINKNNSILCVFFHIIYNFAFFCKSCTFHIYYRASILLSNIISIIQHHITIRQSQMQPICQNIICNKSKHNIAKHFANLYFIIMHLFLLCGMVSPAAPHRYYLINLNAFILLLRLFSFWLFFL